MHPKPIYMLISPVRLCHPKSTCASNVGCCSDILVCSEITKRPTPGRGCTSVSIVLKPTVVRTVSGSMSIVISRRSPKSTDAKPARSVIKVYRCSGNTLPRSTLVNGRTSVPIAPPAMPDYPLSSRTCSPTVFRSCTTAPYAASSSNAIRRSGRTSDSSTIS